MRYGGPARLIVQRTHFELTSRRITLSRGAAVLHLPVPAYASLLLFLILVDRDRLPHLLHRVAAHDLVLLQREHGVVRRLDGWVYSEHDSVHDSERTLNMTLTTTLRVLASDGSVIAVADVPLTARLALSIAREPPVPPIALGRPSASRRAPPPRSPPARSSIAGAMAAATGGGSGSGCITGKSENQS